MQPPKSLPSVTIADKPQLFMMIQTNWTLVKICSGTNRHKFEAICWLLLQTCQTDRQGHEFLPSRPSPLGKTYRWCSGPWSTSQLHWSFSGKQQNINHPKWIGLTARINFEIPVLLMQLHYYSFSTMICSCGTGQLRCGLCFPEVLSGRSWSRFLQPSWFPKVGVHHSNLGWGLAARWFWIFLQQDGCWVHQFSSVSVPLETNCSVSRRSLSV